MSTTRQIAVFAVTFCVASALAPVASAQSRTEVLRWEDELNDDGEVIGYRVYFGTAPRAYTESVDVGVPPVVAGAFEASVAVDADADIYFAVTAYSDSAESLFSNERCRGAAGPCAATPPPDDPPDDPSADPEVVGFALWDAAADQLIDASFQSGESIVLPDNDCVAIEILGNSRLDASGPGSIKKVFNGEDNGCTSVGTTHENSAPFAWEVDEGPGQFACAPSLTQAGNYTLTVTPFAGDDCSGAAGSPVTLEFQVMDDSGTPPPEPLGQPGQPQVVFP